MPNAPQMTVNSFRAQMRHLQAVMNLKRAAAMGRAMSYLFVKVRQKLKAGQPLMRWNQFLWGANPSFAGDSPKSVHGKLAESIGGSLKQYNHKLGTITVGTIFSRAKHAAFQEFGANVPARFARGRAMVMPVTGRNKYYRPLGSTRSAMRKSLRGVVFRRYARGFKLHPRPWLGKTIMENANALISIMGHSLGMKVHIK